MGLNRGWAKKYNAIATSDDVIKNVVEVYNIHFIMLTTYCVNNIEPDGIGLGGGGVWGSFPRKFLRKCGQNPAILDTSDEFIGLHIFH